eukprot:COSAG05_NODE_249_length_12903_cov_128.635505_12_plen_89_part_00
MGWSGLQQKVNPAGGFGDGDGVGGGVGGFGDGGVSVFSAAGFGAWHSLALAHASAEENFPLPSATAVHSPLGGLSHFQVVLFTFAVIL